MLPSPGFWLEQPNLAALEIAAILGYRVVIIDMEHGVVTAESCNALVAQARAIGMTILIRVAAADRYWSSRPWITVPIPSCCP